MNLSLSRAANSRSGGRDVVFEKQNQFGKCKLWLFHGGIYYNDCKNSSWENKDDC